MTLDAELSQSLVALARSEAGLDLARQASGGDVIFRSADGMDKKAQAFIEEARRRGVDPSQWRILANASSISGKATTLNSPLIVLASVPHSAKAMARLAGAGADPWSCNAFPSKDNAQHLAVEKMNPVAMAGIATHDGFPLTVRKILVATCAKSLPLDCAPNFFTALEKRWAGALSRSNITAQALLGDGDRALKSLAQAIAHAAEPLRQAAAATEGRFDPPLDAPARVEALLAACEAAVTLKASKTAVADPEKIKKSLTPAQRTGLASLRIACRATFDPQERVEKTFNEQAWIAKNPLAACLRIARQPSPMELALRRRNAPALRKLREVGSNVWLAAAQANQPKAPLWALSMRLQTEEGRFKSGEWPDDVALEVAKLLLQGAWLNGGADPKAICREQILSCLDEQPRLKDPRWPGYVEQMASLCERVDLEEALGGLSRAEDSAPARAPSKKRMAL